MVYFACGACGQSLKKNQVEKHYQQKCFDCNVLSCLDCSKEFYGEEYQKHVKCITEEEKYFGKAYVPKVNKGEAKQEEWICRITEIMQETPVKPDLRKLLEQIKVYPNIPRKKNKFENFVKNSFPYVRPDLISKAWDIFSQAQAKPPVTNGTTVTAAQNGKTEQKQPTKRKAEISEDASETKKPKKSQHPEEKADGSNDFENKKFDWEQNLVEILETKGQISIKKLQKKILARYSKFYGLEDSSAKETKLVAKLQRKIADRSKFELSETHISLKK